MNSINAITLTGRCGGDPEIKYFSDGNAVSRFSLAVTRKFRGEEDVFWVEANIWGKSAQNAADWVKKGTLVALTGRVEPAEAWVDKDGKARAKLRVSVNQWEVLRQPSDGHSGQQQQFRSLAEELPF